MYGDGPDVHRLVLKEASHKSCWLPQLEPFGGPPPAAAGATLADLAAGAAAIADIFIQKGFANKVPTPFALHAAAGYAPPVARFGARRQTASGASGWRDRRPAGRRRRRQRRQLHCAAGSACKSMGCGAPVLLANAVKLLARLQHCIEGWQVQSALAHELYRRPPSPEPSGRILRLERAVLSAAR